MSGFLQITSPLVRSCRTDALMWSDQYRWLTGCRPTEGGDAATFPPTCAAYIFPPEGSAGLILPTAVPMNRPSAPPGFSWTACRVYLASKQRTRLRRRSDSVNASRQSVCSGSSSPRDAAVCLPVWTRQRRRQARCLCGEILYRRRPPGENSETKGKHVCGEVGWIVVCCEFRRQFWFQSLT